ncbi:MAG: dihydrofolate reductase family protein [Cyclobacteriaceae bacterium]|nr:dihydrofolate reductase family protein [Cyclobacteriaceae bacterium]
MRKIILSCAVSLDGYIEGPNGEYDWCPPPNQHEMNEFMANIDTIFMGRKSFEMMDPSPFPGKELVVFSNTISPKKVTVLGGDIVSSVMKLKQQPGKNIWLFGGASLTTSLLNAGLIDEIGLAIVPIVLGSGKPLFQNIKQRKKFNLVSATSRKDYVMLTLTSNH